MDNVAVLVSGGIDSSVLTVALAEQGARVYPVYIRHGLYWENTELTHLRNWLEAVSMENIQPLSVLELPVADLYGKHWSVSGEDVPDDSTADDAVYLPGRNLLLLSKVGVWCSENGVGAIALAPLKGNPFSDNSDEFYQAMMTAINLALASSLEVIRPFSTLSKREVVELGSNLPLELTFSCIRPENGLHCGRCNKCEERKASYRGLNLKDKTIYSTN